VLGVTVVSSVSIELSIVAVSTVASSSLPQAPRIATEASTTLRARRRIFRVVLCFVMIRTVNKCLELLISGK
jgi:hypothetical protein